MACCGLDLDEFTTQLTKGRRANGKCPPCPPPCPPHPPPPCPPVTCPKTNWPCEVPKNEEAVQRGAGGSFELASGVLLVNSERQVSATFSPAAGVVIIAGTLAQAIPANSTTRLGTVLNYVAPRFLTTTVLANNVQGGPNCLEVTNQGLYLLRNRNRLAAGTYLVVSVNRINCMDCRQ